MVTIAFNVTVDLKLLDPGQLLKTVNPTGIESFNVVYISRFNLPMDFLHLTLRLLMPYIYGAPILDVSRSHMTTQHSR